MKKQNNRKYKTYTRIKSGSPEREKFYNTIDGFEIDHRTWTKQVMDALREDRAKKVNDQDGVLTYKVYDPEGRPSSHAILFPDNDKLTND